MTLTHTPVGLDSMSIDRSVGQLGAVPLVPTEGTYSEQQGMPHSHRCLCECSVPRQAQATPSDLGKTAADNPAATPFLPPEEAFPSDFSMLLSEAAPPNLIHNLMTEARPEEL